MQKFYYFILLGMILIIDLKKIKILSIMMEYQFHTLKYKISFGYSRLERNKDKIFIKIFSKIYEINFFYKKIRPKSQRLTKKILDKWTKTCPVEYHKINDISIGFFYNLPKNFTNVSTEIITRQKNFKIK
jgi:hypothetical protein